MTDKPLDRPSVPARAKPETILLLDDWANHRGGVLLRADADLVARLDVEGARYRVATAADIGLRNGRVEN